MTQAQDQTASRAAQGTIIKSSMYPIQEREQETGRRRPDETKP